MSKWMPIETAPKNGNIILACAVQEEDGIYLALVMWVREDEHLVGTSGDLVGPSCWATIDANAVPVTLTHWASLPDISELDDE